LPHLNFTNEEEGKIQLSTFAESPLAKSPTIPPFRNYHQESVEKGTHSFEITILYHRFVTARDEKSSKQNRLKQVRSISPHNASAGASVMQSSSPNKACAGAIVLGSLSLDNSSTGASAVGSLSPNNASTGASVNSFELSN
jgi:hypothetical protein